MHALQKQVGGRVRELREKRGLSQEALAEACNLHRTYVGLIERGERNLTLGTIEVIAAALEVPVSELFVGIKQAMIGKRRSPKKAVTVFDDLSAHISVLRKVILDAELTDARRYDALFKAHRKNRIPIPTETD